MSDPESRIPRLSFVLPAYAEAENLDSLLPRVLSQAPLADEIDVIVVDDHSPDATFEVVRRWADRDPRVRGVRLSRNSGSHAAILCGLQFARGDAVVVLAADGQDPPEFSAQLVAAWKSGAQVAWAVRDAREGETFATRLFSRIYWRVMNRVSTVRLPPAGADFFLLDRRVVNALCEANERNTQVIALIAWLGFRQVELPYTKHARISGRSKWTLRKKLRLVIDSLVGFSTAPLKAATGSGFVFAGAGFLYAAALIVNHLTGGALWGPTPVEGWNALMVVVLLASGTIMVILGVLGEYLWRALDEARARPRFVLEDTVGGDAPELHAGRTALPRQPTIL